MGRGIEEKGGKMWVGLLKGEVGRRERMFGGVE